MDTTKEIQTHSFQAEVNQLLRLVINSLYSHKEIFLRELISNASDAIDKLRFEAITNASLVQSNPTLEIRILPNREKGTLTIEDTGVGMTRSELIENLGTIAHSGSRAFLTALEKEGRNKDVNLIGQFGVGFYSAYLVADRVEVDSCPANGEGAYRWSSDAQESFTIEPSTRKERGTAITLHLKSDQRKHLEEWDLRELITRYSDYVSHPIRLFMTRTQGVGAEEKTESSWETINRASALWQRSPNEVTKEQYEEFYKHLTHDFEAPLAYTHFKIEGTLLFSGILFIPRKPPFELYTTEQKRGIRLFAKRVFIMEDCEELVPSWLRFVRGVVDSDDLPLNVSREILQDSSVIRTIRKQVDKKVLERLEELAAEAPSDYNIFWKQFGPVLKEGVVLDEEHRERILPLMRYESTKSKELTSLSDYITRMPEGQSAIYYAMGDSITSMATSPYLEALQQRGFEVLFMTDPVDEWAVDTLKEFQGKPLVSAMRANLKLDAPQENEKKTIPDNFKSLWNKIKDILKDRVTDVHLSERLTDSPCVLVVPEGNHHAHWEHLLRASGRPTAASAGKRILEINPAHPLIESLRILCEKDPASTQLTEWVETLYDQAVLTEGGRIEDPNRFAKRITNLLQQAANHSTHANG